jgi:Tfp pilus assembly protein PilV
VALSGAAIDRAMHTGEHDMKSVKATPPTTAELGMTLLEVMIASLLFLAVSLGVVPMFTQSMVSNTSGNDSTKAANFARGRAEELMQLPFNHPDLTIDAGSAKVLDEYYSSSDPVWRPFPVPAGKTPEWTRTTTVRQYNVDALEDDLVEISEALPAGTDPSFVHLKEIQVGVAQGGSIFTSLAKTITVRTLRAH